MSQETVTTPTAKPKKSVALSGVIAGNTALCTVGRSGNDLHYRGYDILDVADTCEFEEIAYLLAHGALPTRAELAGYKRKLKALRDKIQVKAKPPPPKPVPPKPKAQDDDAFLFAQAGRPEFILRWHWRVDDIAFWDNRITQHYAVADYLPERRVMHRATVIGDRPA